MTPYEVSLRKKLSQAAELSCTLSNWKKMAGYDSVSEESILQALIQQIETTSQHFDDQLERYRNLSEKRRRLASESDDCIKKLTDRLWEDISYQFRGGTVANDLLKILCQKIHRFPLPDFPVSRRNPLHYKTVRLHEDSYALFGQYFGWLVDLLLVVKFTPVRPPHCLEKLSEQAAQFNVLTQQVMLEAETLRKLQLTKDQLYRQLYQSVRTAKGRLLLYKRETRPATDHFIEPSEPV
ncbi:hypothetical protein [Spirosoma validum]|uniref:Uncharacterized protein n=1 Tax=Spirosoma validum TaxID=2771355 RepID=A0A927GG88_9BACT|nr:hypothetical protein [Spirosoma validum]MBD2756742.1 hypothetical protein [Spirosoma validum]